MHRNQRHRIKIYHSGLHLAMTFLIVVMPFLFLLFFSKAEKIATDKLFADVFISIFRLFVAYIIAVALAWLLAIVFYRGRLAAVGLPIFDVLQSFPTFAALPIAVLYWGQNNFTVIFFLVLTVIWPIFFSIVSSLKLIRSDWEEAVEIYNLKGVNYLKNFLWPLSIPGIITGSVIGLGDGWGALVATEIIVNLKNGLGNFFQGFAQNTTVTALGIFSLLLIVFSINKLIWSPLLESSHKLMEE